MTVGHSLDFIRKEIEIRGGFLVSTKYKNENSPLMVRCVNGHEFRSRFRYIRRGNWCKECFSDSVRRSVDEVRKIIEDRGGVLLSEYKNAMTKLHLRCEKGHDVWMKYNDIQQGHWCRKCADQELRLDEDEIYRFVAERGGRVLSRYENSYTKMKLRCGAGHIWKTTANVLRSQESWCPECYKIQRLKREYVVRDILEKMFGLPFPNMNIPGVGYPVTKRPIEIDCYNLKLEVGIEVNGKQHYERVPYFHKTEKAFQDQRRRDAYKRKICEESDITLVVIPYTVKEKNLRAYIEKRFSEMAKTDNYK